MKFASCIVKDALRKLKNVGDRANQREGRVTGGYHASVRVEESRDVVGDPIEEVLGSEEPN